MDEKENKIKVFGNDEESLKILGQLLSNETSRKIIGLLTEKEMYTNEISKTLGIQMNLTIHHIQKLEEIGLLTVRHKPIVRKGVDHKFYKVIPNLFVTQSHTTQEMQDNKFFKKFFKEGIKFAVIAFVGAASWITGAFNIFQVFDKSDKDSIVDSIMVVNKTTDIIKPEINEQGNFFLVPIIIIGASLFLIWFSNKYK